MNSISNDINKIINDEIININKKIKGSSILEILKSKIIEKINQIYDDIGSNNDLEASKEYNYEDENKSISAKINYYETPKILLNTILNKNILIICLNKYSKIDIEDSKTKKNITINLYPKTGITIPKNSKCSFNYSKDSLVVEINHEDKLLDIENLNENTI